MRSLEPVDVVVVGVYVPETPDGLWTSPEMFDPQRGEPAFYSAEVARFFFGRSPVWLRHHLWRQHLVLDAWSVGIPRTVTADQRRWRLYDIERAAHALAQGGFIKVEHLVRVIEIVKLVAQNYRYLIPLPLETRIESHVDEVARRVVAPMAVETLTRMRDDLTGELGAKSRTFGVGDNRYLIDLTDESWAAFLDLLRPYISAAQPALPREGESVESAEERRVIRGWARVNGYSVGNRGRLSAQVLRAYADAHTGEPS